MEVELTVEIERQRDYATCGPASLHGTRRRRVGVHRLLTSIFLRVGSDDGNLLRLRPKDWRSRVEARQR